MKKIMFIINPISGTNKQSGIISTIYENFPEDEFEYDICFTSRPKHATELSLRAIEENYDVAVAIGGDGTMHEVGKSLIGSKVALSIIPRGSGNGLARNMGIPTNLKKAIEVLKEGKTVKVDTVKINEDSFIGIAGLGFDGLIAKDFATYGKRGMKTYTKIVLSEFSHYKPDHYELEIDGVKYEYEAFLISFANSAQFGNNAIIAPNASMSDGLIDVCIMKEFPYYQGPAIAARLFTKTIDKSKYMEIIRGRSIKVKFNHSHLHLDGEPFDLGNHLNININPKSLNLVVPGYAYSKRTPEQEFIGKIIGVEDSFLH